jgi:hypothetical protein
VRRVLSARTDPNSAFLALLGFLLLLLVFVMGGKKYAGKFMKKIYAVGCVEEKK